MSEAENADGIVVLNKEVYHLKFNKFLAPDSSFVSLYLNHTPNSELHSKPLQIPYLILRRVILL